MRIIKIMIILLLLAIGFPCYAQEKTPKCFSDQLLQQAIKQNPEIGRRLEKFDKAIETYSENGVKKKSGNEILTIPVVIYVVYGGGTSNISDAQIFSQMDALNNAFADIGIQFCLATRAGAGTTTVPIQPGCTHTAANPGIIRLSNGILTNHNAANDQAALMNATVSGVSGTNFLRIWVVTSITGTGNGGTTLGYATMPNSSAFDGVVMRSDVFGDIGTCPTCVLRPNVDQGKTLVHEVGHYLGLYHTFHNGCAGMNPTTCKSEGDKVCDTPPTKDPNFDCSPQNSCNETAPNLPDAIHNFMDYGDDTCVDSFTEGQGERMLSTLAVGRANLTTVDNQIYAGVCGYQTLVSSSFNADIYSPCVGGTVNFKPVVTDDPAVTYEWDFGDPASGSNTSTAKFPSHPYNSTANAPYKVTLTVTKGTSVSTSVALIYPVNCAPIASTDGNWYFSDRNGLKFNTGTPIYDNSILTAGNTVFGEASAVQSNTSGQLLFYTDGLDVFNSSHTEINSVPLKGDPSIHGGALIVPMPGNSNKYYIFLTRSGFGANGLTYSIVDVTGTTATMSSVINQPVTIPLTGYMTGLNNAVITAEGITAIQHCNGYWLICTNKKTDGTLYMNVFNITAANGIQHTSEYPLPSNLSTFMSRIKTSPDGNRVAYTGSPPSGLIGGTFIFDFDKNNGILSNRTSLDYDNGYGISFSPNSNLLYVTDYAYAFISQFNVATGNPGATRVSIGDFKYDGDLQLGPDNKIYISQRDGDRLGVIHKPNSLVTEDAPNACHLTKNGPVLLDEIFCGLPNIIDAKMATVYTQTIGAYPISCFEYKFSANVNVCGSSFSWDFGDPNSSSNTSTLANPSHVFTGTGPYTITFTYNGNSISKTINITNPDVQILGNPKVCTDISNYSNHSVAVSPEQNIQWTVSGNGSIIGLKNQSNITVAWNSLPGTITATVTTDSGCSSSSTVEVISDCSEPTDCPSNLNFTGPEALTSKIYSASNSIVTEGNYQVPVNADISLLATTYVTLKPDTWIKNGALFLADIRDCIPSNDKISQNSQLIAYPNPTDGLLHIQGIKFNEVYLFDVLGKSVFNARYDGIDNTIIDMNRLTQGIYFLKVISTDGNMETLKIIKE